MISTILKKKEVRRVAVIVGAVLIVALGICVVARGMCGMDDHRLSQDACAGTTMLLSAAILLVAPLSNSRFLPVPDGLLPAVLLNLPDPPPKLSFLS